ncbi:hypothetical protein EK21DRAFT_90219 [Setomelanomma holmii]|uniref:Myb-like domain-containing protein n=1 Tax=Setomelanomma holmii TaxID=210430 RepID=A0A9P4H7K4_9PLEO|nr:hypothetical protein EK21DRAFT_90219 [Setomelanomma holmii]
MSTEEGVTQPPTAGSDKTQAPKAAATFSSFINKNTTGKKFAPKVARRRPGAAPAPRPAAPEPTAPSVEAQTEQPEVVHSTITQLPTPASTQEHIVRNAMQTEPSQSAVAPADTAPAILEESTPTVSQPTPSPTVTTTHVGSTGRGGDEEAPPAQPIQDVHDDGNAVRPVKRRRIDAATRKSTVVDNELSEAATATPETLYMQLEEGATAQVGQVETITCAQPTQEETLPPQQSQQEPDVASAVVDRVQEGHSNEAEQIQQTAEEAPAPRSRKRRVLPWVAVNRTPDEEEVEEETAPAPPKKNRQPPKPRGKKKAAAAMETQDGEQQDDAIEEEAQPGPKRPSAKARGKRRADAMDPEEGAEPSIPAKRARRPGRAKDKEGTTNAGDEGEEAGDEGGEVVVRRKPRQPKRKKAATEGEGNGDGTQPKRKGRPPREATPSDAEDQEIDPEATFMDSLASRNIRVGKLSDREKAMRGIDWVAVRQRQREEDTRPIQTKQIQEQADKLLAEFAPPPEPGIQYTLVGDQIQVVHSSTVVDREADADLQIQNYEVVEEQDLTARITSRSFMKNNKRFPNDFLLPGQGKKWTSDDTELFYQGLRNFGTDFQMISHMFPGSNRRSIKLKFTREERENPDIVREALHGRSEIASNWETFMEASQMQDSHFKDVDQIKLQMEAEAAEFREQIETAKAETLERKRQQREAGMLDEDGDGNEASNKENSKGKRKNKGKQKQVTFQEEAGVEIVGNIDDDHTWGQERIEPMGMVRSGHD